LLHFFHSANQNESQVLGWVHTRVKSLLSVRQKMLEGVGVKRCTIIYTSKQAKFKLFKYNVDQLTFVSDGSYIIW